MRRVLSDGNVRERLPVFLRCLLLVAPFVTVLALIGTPSNAQLLPASSAQLDKLQQAMQGTDGQQNSSEQYQTQNAVLQPTAPPEPNNTVSRLERIMSARAGMPLREFGYDQLGVGRPMTVPQSGSLQDNYILGPGDEIAVTLRGQENNEYRMTVDRNGAITLPRLSPISAAGRTLADVRAELQNAVQRAYIQTQAFVTIGRLRLVNVMVAGEVAAPGMRLVNGLSSTLDAILLSGGIKKTGSLRNVRLVHGGRQTVIDLYAYLAQGRTSQNVLLSDGDRIIVPPLGAVVGVGGWVRRPGIYELPPGQSGLAAQSLIALAGGLEVRGRYRLSVMRILPSGASSMVELNDESGIVRDSEILLAQTNAQGTEQRAVLSGGTPLAGQYSVGNVTTLADLLKAAGALGETPYTLFGLIVRRDPTTQQRILVPFTPAAVLSGADNMDLRSDDVVRVFSVNEARLLLAIMAVVREHQAETDVNLHSPSYADSTGFQNNGNLTNTGQDERRIIAELASKTLSEGGELSDRLPTNEYPPYGLTQGQRNFLFGSQSATPATVQPQIVYPPDNRDDSQRRNGESDQSQGSYAPPVGSQRVVQTGGQAQGLYPPNYPTLNYPLPSWLQTPTLPNGAGQSSGAAAASNEQSQNVSEQGSSTTTVPTNWEVQTLGQLSRQLNIDPLILVHFLMDHDATISGSVRGEGTYLVGPSASLNDLVQAAGGKSVWTDNSAVEVITTTVEAKTGQSRTEHLNLPLDQSLLASYIVKPHDEIRLNRADTVVDAGVVTVQGQVRYAGSYRIERGERLSELLLRAGGLTDVAYPYGTVFLRKSVAAIERAGYQRAAKEMEDMFVTAIRESTSTNHSAPESTGMLQSFITELRNTPALGRIAIVADPVVLASDPSHDPLLESGDVIYIPQRPSTVTVLGQVMQQGSVPFDPKMSVGDYIERTGGFASTADKSLVFVVLPDGTARRAETSWLDVGSATIPPGSTIVVPRDMSFVDIRQIVLDVGALLSNLAISAASLYVISTRNTP